MERKLYPGIAFSPQATLTENIGEADTIIKVSDVSAFPEAPNLATIGIDEDGETILYTAKTEDTLSGCQRGVEGAAKAWKAGEIIGRNFTAKDHNDLIAAISENRDAVEQNIRTLIGQAVSTTDITNKEIDLNDLVSNKVKDPYVQAYYCRTSGGGNNITNKPSGIGGNFVLWVEKSRSNNDTDYSVIQTLKSFSDNMTYYEYQRVCRCGGNTPSKQNWSEWKQVNVPGYLGLGTMFYQADKDDSGNMGAYLSSLGITAQNTLSELLSALPAGSFEIYFNSHDNPLNNEMPVTTGGVLHIYKAVNTRGSLSFTDYRTGNIYVSPYIDGADISWAKVPTSRECPNPNLLDDWYFPNPVNRNGLTIYPTLKSSANSSIFIDRWCYGYGLNGVALDPNGITISYAESTYNFIYQELPPGLPDFLRGKTVTLSAIIKGTGSFSIGNVNYSGSKTFYVNSDYELYSVTYTWPTTADKWKNRPRISVNDASSLSILAAKLELGGQQTLAHKEGDEWVLNEIPNYAEQYAICSQYSPATGEFVGSQRSNPNLLDNWYFADPVNQRGEKNYPFFTSGNYSHFIDRWLYAQNLSISLGNDGLVIEGNPEQSGFKFIQQRIAPEKLDFVKGKIVTLSCLIKGKGTIRIGTINGSTNKEFEIDSDDYVLLENTFTFNNSGNSTTEINTPLVAVNTGTATILAAKLELGPIQTLAHKEGDKWALNDPPPDKALELAKCQHYQIQLCSTDAYGAIGIGTAVAAGGISVFVPTPATLRAAPTLIHKGAFCLVNSVSASKNDAISVSEMRVDRWQNNGVYIACTVASDLLTVGTAYTLQIKNDANASMVLDSNL